MARHVGPYRPRMIFVAVARGPRQGGVDPIQKLADVQRLGEIAEEACFDSLLYVARHGAGAERQDRRRREVRFALQPLHHHVTVEVGKVDIEDDQVRTTQLGHGEPRRAILSSRCRNAFFAQRGGKRAGSR